MWEEIKTLAPFIITGLFSYGGGYLTFKAATLKNTTDVRSATVIAEEKLREDLLAIIEDYKEVKEKQDVRIAEQQGQIDTLRAMYAQDMQNLHAMNADLRLQNANLQYENAVLKNNNARIEARVKELEEEFAKIERRVFYRPTIDKGEQA